MLVRSDLFAKQNQLGIAVGIREIAELLIVGPVLLNNVDNVLDLAALSNPLRNDA